MGHISEYSQLQQACEEAGRIGAKELLARRDDFKVSRKSQRDLVTEADLASQAVVREFVEAEFPKHAFLGEEDASDEALNEEYCWVVDPLDGTTNYVHGFPFFAVSIAVCRNARVVAGAVIDPIHDEVFSASAGGGAVLNGGSLSSSQTTELTDALVAVSFAPEFSLDSPDMQSFVATAPKCRAVRRMGSAALNLCYVASGRLDVHWAHEIFPWDAAAGVLIAAESGAVVTSTSGTEFRIRKPDYLVAATSELHSSVLELIKKALDR